MSPWFADDGGLRPSVGCSSVPHALTMQDARIVSDGGRLLKRRSHENFVVVMTRRSSTLVDGASLVRLHE
jgi:hypothetical protein